jgi:hypothetical protein
LANLRLAGSLLRLAFSPKTLKSKNSTKVYFSPYISKEKYKALKTNDL